MRTSFFFVAFLNAANLFSQTIPLTETTFTIHKKEKQQFSFSMPKNYLLKATVIQKGIDLGISIYKKDDSNRLRLFDSPNGENGPEPIAFESPANGDYTLVIEQIEDDSVLSGQYTIRQISIRPLGPKIDSSFSTGSGIVIGEPDKLKTNNLTNLCMLWGFLKYHHPAIARGDYNWDAELFRVVPKILNAQTKTEASDILEKWVDGLEKPTICKTCKPIKSDSSIKLMPDYGNLFTSGNLNNSLIEKLNYIKDNRNQDDNYYIQLFEGVGNPIFDNENPYKKMVYPDAGYRLLSLFRYWNIIQYFYPYKYLIGEDWNKVLPEFIPKFISAKDSTQYALACLEVIARIHDTHANIYGNKTLANYFGKYYVPFQAKFIEDKLVTTGYYSDTFAIKEKIKPGDVITKINGVPVKELVKNNLYLTPASNYSTQLRSLPTSALLRSNDDSMRLEIISNYKKISLTIKCIEPKYLNLGIDYNPLPKDSSYKIINGNIGYLFPGRYKNEQLQRIKKAFENTKGIIIDMRCYPSAFMPFTFGHYIKPAASPFVKFTVGDTKNPGLFTFGPLYSNGEPNPDYYKGPIVDIVNEVTQSQAEYTTMAFQSAPDVTVIGSTTAGADGNVSEIMLPGGIFTYISGIGVYYLNGEDTQRKGVKIDVAIKPTIKGIKNGKDELLEKAVEIINSKNTKSN
jgi:hypothetical protein